MLQETRITDSLTMYTTSFMALHATVVESSHFLTVIDTFLRPADSKELAAIVTTQNKPLRFLLNTHWHSDHCSGNRFVMQKETIKIAQNHYWDTYCAERTLLHASTAHWADKRVIPKPDIVFYSSLELPEIPLQIIHKPGHTPDASIVYFPESGVLLSGDTILNSDNGQIAIPYFQWGSYTDILDSLRSLQQMNISTIIPGHGLPCEKRKIDGDVMYLERLAMLLNAFHEAYPDLESEELIHQAQQEIKTEDCLPGTKADDFWVPKMHTLNVARYIREKWFGQHDIYLQGGCSID